MATVEDQILFVILPYVAIAVAVATSVVRYYTDQFSISSLSSQLLEKRQLSWSSVSWHYGIIVILGVHMVAAIFPSAWNLIITNPVRLYVMEVTGWALAIFLGVALAALIARRVVNSRMTAVTSTMDWVLLSSLILQVVLGVSIATTQRWGAVWYLQQVVPWLQSLVTFNPQIQTVSFLPLIVKIHILNALLLVALIPFTRLIHMFVTPMTYLWRPYQVVIWSRSNPKVIDETEIEIRNEQRRTFIKFSITGAVALTLGGAAVTLMYITARTAAPSTTFPKVKIANLSDLKVGQPVYFNYPLQDEPNILVKLGEKADDGTGPDGDIVAFSQICQHLGCSIAYQAPDTSPTCNTSYKALGPVGYCCCHGSIYDFIHKAKVEAGPAPRPVPQVTLELDTSSGDIYAVGMGPPAIYGHNTGSSDASSDLEG
jgi:nitrate reductase gamma subunit